ncbi:hypothetical protein [Amniculibacterium sp. G2-70]|uniref:hypothetical protein n=1 Tax=Amniculibacterium sp. G2-70 TaxID=2767188 RepID=UPI0016543815|nr:hypothetical protein [Amniculibacterium sp. G2-70]
MRKFIKIFVLLIIINGCTNSDNKLVSFTTRFGNAIIGVLNLEFYNDNNLLVIKRIGPKYNSPYPPPPKIHNEIHENNSDEINSPEVVNIENSTAYKLNDKESEILIKLINAIPETELKDYYPKYPLGDGFGYNFQILYSNGIIKDIEVQHQNITSHEKLINQMLTYALKYEKNKDNLKVLNSFEDWNHPKY